MPPSTKPVALVVGASRGIGRQVAIDLARSGYAVVVAAKSISNPDAAPFPPDPNSPASTISTVTREITLAGGEATPLVVDVRSPESVEALVSATISTYSRLDVVIYNSGAIFWAPVSKTPLRRFQLMQRVNPEGLYAVVQAALPHLSRASFTPPCPAFLQSSPPAPSAGRIVVISPPIYSRFFRGKTAYAMGKVGMSVLTKGLAMDLEREGRSDMAVTSLWPASAIQSAATAQFTSSSPSELAHLRNPSIFSHAILAILAAPAPAVNGHLLLDEDFLRQHIGITDLSPYNVVPGSSPRRIMPKVLPDLRVAEQDDEGRRVDSTAISKL
ncbi:hypothetical protein CDD81_4097 [Ophiocordyceps australis]|uniref:Short chain dehydrogenase n=1 Tax=Ophiocordyceps australis TaxID=1399860 RepID=A0A2C5YAC0_9HYPO|nr:hypothetical protein CDD81_4097 [Ophiocordyceps australis]